MIESCIVSARLSRDMVCPAHKSHPLPIRDIAPDVVSVVCIVCMWRGVWRGVWEL